MNTLLIFLTVALVVIIVSIALQKLLKCPILVAALVFSIILLVAVILSSTTLIIAAIFFGILSYIVIMIQCILNRLLTNNNKCNDTNSESQSCSTCNCENNTSRTNNNITGTFCGCYRRR